MSRPWSFSCGDGIEGLLGHGHVDHVIVDPPYAEEVQLGHEAVRNRDNRFGFDPMTDEERNRAARAIGMRCRRWTLVFCSDEETHLWRFALEAAGLSVIRTGHWIRLGTMPQMNAMGPAQGSESIVIAHSRLLTLRWNGGGKPAVWYHPIVRSNERVHPTQKPTSLLSELIADFTDEGETIADTYAGVATTGVAALGLGRKFVGWELKAELYQKGLSRLDMPLFERSPKQIEIEGVVPKGARARARMELERRVLNMVYATGADGISVSRLAELVQGTPKEVETSLKKLAKAGAVERRGKTSATRWYGIEEPPTAEQPQHEESVTETP